MTTLVAPFTTPLLVDTRTIPEVDAPSAPLRAPWSAERRALHAILKTLGDPPLEFVLWSGERVGGIDAVAQPPVARIHIHDPRALRQMVVNPELGFGDAFTMGDVAVEGDLVAALEAVYRARDRRPSWTRWRERVSATARRVGRGSLTGAQANIRQHYDLGNDFFSWWLDEDMVYTCAYFSEATMSLEAAQVQKMDHVCRKLRLKPGDRVVEAGCGWGALTRHMVRHYGVHVTAYDISAEQLTEARLVSRALRLDDRITFVEDDYRNIRGEYDAFVSVGMLELVGPETYEALGRVISRSLTPHGMGLIHTIAQARPEPLNAWIEQRIFPGAHPPTLTEMMPLLEHADLTVLDVENLRLHYAQTLEHWLER